MITTCKKFDEITTTEYTVIWDIGQPLKEVGQFFHFVFSHFPFQILKIPYFDHLIQVQNWCEVGS